MSELHPLGAAKTIVNLSSDLMKVAKENPDAQEAGQYAAKTLRIVAQTVHNVLLPIAAINYGITSFETYMKGKFGSDLSDLTLRIPPEQLVSPKPAVAGPAMQALVFTHEEPDLKNMFLNLIATSMDARVQESAHPAFVEIVKQLDGREAGLLRFMLSLNSTMGIAEIRSGENEYHVIERNVLDLSDAATGEAAVDPQFPAWVDNWVRLGLFTLSFTTYLVKPKAYDWIELRPEYLRHVASGKVPMPAKGVLGRTSFGTQFAIAIGVKVRVPNAEEDDDEDGGSPASA